MPAEQRHSRSGSTIPKPLVAWGLVLPRQTRWGQLTTRQRGGLAARGTLQFVLLAAALRDLHNRAPHEVRGRKWIWAVVSGVNYLGLGPIVYFAFGRRARTNSAPSVATAGRVMWAE